MINYFVDFSETTVSIVAASGDSIVTVGDASFIDVSHSIYIGAELHTIDSINGNDITLTGTLAGEAAVDTIVVIDDSAHDAETLLTAKRSIFGWTPSSVQLTKTWVRRKTLSLTVSPTFSGVSSATYISWPIPGDDHYDDRPQEGIDAGWDSDSVENARLNLDATGIYFKLRACTIHKIDLMDMTGYEDDPSDTASMFEHSNHYMTLEKCNINGYRLWYTASNSTYLHYYKFIDCDISLYMRMSEYRHADTQHVYLPFFTRCNFRFKEGTSQSLVYISRAYSPSSLFEYLHFYDCHIYYESNIQSLFFSPWHYNQNPTDTSAIFNSTIELTLHSDGFNIEYIFMYAQSFTNSKIKLTGVGDGSTLTRLVHFQTTDSTKNRFKNVVIEIDNATIDKVFDNNYGVVGYLNIDVKNSIIGTIFVDTQREAIDSFLKIEDTQIRKLTTVCTSMVKNITKVGDTDFFISTLYGKTDILNSDMSGGTTTDSVVNVGEYGECNIYDSFYSSGDNLISTVTKGDLSIFNSNPFLFIERRKAFQTSIDAIYRNGSSIESSILVEAVESYSFGIYSLGDGETYGMKALISEGDTAIDVYIAWSGEELPTYLDIGAVVVFDSIVVSDFEIIEDLSSWTPDISSTHTMFKIRVNVPSGYTGDANVKIDFIGRGTRYTYFVDPSILSV